MKGLSKGSVIRKKDLNFVAPSITAASYIDGFIDNGLTEDEAIHLIKKSVQIATEARDEFWVEIEHESPNRPKPLVAASVGPYGAFLADPLIST